MPSNVRRATKLLWTSAALVVVFLVVVAVGLVALPGHSILTAADLVTNLLTFGVLALLAIKLSKRRNWARWVLAAIAGFGAVAMIFSMVVVPDIWRSASLPTYGFAVLQTVLQLWALALVFTSQAGPWFARGAAA